MPGEGETSHACVDTCPLDWFFRRITGDGWELLALLCFIIDRPLAGCGVWSAVPRALAACDEQPSLPND